MTVMTIPKKIIIVGATSGIGKEVALLYVKAGWQVGIAGRRKALLDALQQTASSQIYTQIIDVRRDDAPRLLRELIDRMGGIDLYLHSSGIGAQNMALDEGIELQTVETNALGFIRMIDTVFHYFKEAHKQGHIAVISSIAGTKGLGVAAAYSATKRFQNTYLQCLSQLAHMQHLPITFTDIRPGFTDTDLLKNSRYPLLMQPTDVARQIVKALEKKRRTVVIDWRYRMLVSAWSLIPHWLWERLTIR